MLATVFFYQLFLAVMTFSPPFGSVWGQFVTDFRVWCFGYDPATGSMQWTAAWIMLTEPLLMQGIIIALWRKPLWDALRFGRRQMIPQISAALMTVTAVAAGLLFIGTSDASADEVPPFPGERIRTTLQPPEINLFNQHGDPVRLADHRGGIVLVTAIYSTCSTSCPMLMFQAKRAIEELSPEQQEDLTVMAISLDPENDNLELMAEAAAVYGMDAPKFQFLNGDPEAVNTVLDRLQIARMRNTKTNEIDHANLYFVIDRQGHIAYRFNLSDRHQPWLVEALQQLLDEAE